MIWDVLKKFKNQFHLARRAIDDMSQPNIGINMRYEKDKDINTSLNLPPETEISRFATVLRPLADPTSSIYFKKIAQILIEHNLTKISDGDKEALQKNINSIERGSLRFSFNDEALSALDLYILFSNGEYFSEAEAAAKKLREIKAIPMAYQLLFFQFYDYSFNAYKVCEYLYFAVREAEKTHGNENRSKYRQVDSQCIYCLAKDGDFTKEEHVYPESLGNTEIILPPGNVCDSCNNGVLSTLDDFLVNHDSITLLRAMYVPYNPKTGKFISAHYQNLKVDRSHPRKINIKMQSGSNKGFDVKDIGDGECSIKFTAIGRVPFDPKQLGRALYKIALGIVCWANGSNIALDKRYDPARDYISGKSTFPNNLFISEECIPCEYIEGQHVIGNPGTSFTMRIFGIIFLFNLEPEPFVPMNEEIEKLKFACHSLSD